VLDELANLEAVWKYIASTRWQPRKILFDLCGIDRLTSSGAKLWLAFLKPVESRFTFSFTRLGSAFVRQSLLIPILGSRSNAIAEAAVTAFCQCQGCGTESEVEFSTPSENDPVSLKGACTNCDGSLGFDDDLEAYQSLFRLKASKSARVRSDTFPRAPSCII